MSQISETEALKCMAIYCSAGEHCRMEVTEKLVRWGLPHASIVSILNRLEAGKYIDEERFCRAFINDKLRIAKWGRIKIAQALTLKKIPPATYRSLLREIDQEEYLSTLQKLLKAKRRSIHEKNECKLNDKLIRFALSRGFEMEKICHVLRQVESDKSE